MLAAGGAGTGEVVVAADLAGALPVGIAPTTTAPTGNLRWRRGRGASWRPAPLSCMRMPPGLDAVVLGAALDHAGGQRGDAAAALGLSRNTVTRKLGPCAGVVEPSSRLKPSCAILPATVPRRPDR